MLDDLTSLWIVGGVQPWCIYSNPAFQNSDGFYHKFFLINDEVKLLAKGDYENDFVADLGQPVFLFEVYLPKSRYLNFYLHI